MSAVWSAGEAVATRAAAGLLLEALSPFGPVVVVWPAQVQCAAQAAVALERAQAWMQVLERWLGADEGLDWRPAALDASALTAASVDAGAASAPAWIALPWSALTVLPAPPEALQLRWPAVGAELLLSAQPLPPEDASLLAPGSVLLLEASFDPTGWRVALRRPGAAVAVEAMCLGGRLGAVTGSEPGAGLASTRLGMHPHALEIVADLPAPLPVPVLAGWTPPSMALPADAPLRLVHRRADGPDAVPVTLAHGHRLPWGQGQALRVTEVLVERAWT